MKEGKYNNYLKKVIKLLLIIIKLNLIINDSDLLTKELDIDYTHTLSLLNGNIFILHKTGAIVYNYNFTIILYMHDFGTEIINSEEENSLTSINQCEDNNNQYVVALIKNDIHIFSSRGLYLFSIDNTTLFSDFSTTNLVYIDYSFLYYKYESSNYYFTITYKNNYNKMKIVEFIINMNNKLFNFDKEIISNVDIVSDSISSQIINSNNFSNKLFCFYVKNVDGKNIFLLNLFDIENNFEIINETIFFQYFDFSNNYLIKTVMGNQNKRILIDFMSPDCWTYRWFAFDYDLFQISEIKYGTSCETGTKLITLNYVSYINNYALTCKYNNYVTLSFIKDDLNLANIELTNSNQIDYIDNCTNFKNHEVIFLPYEGKYNLITNFICNSTTTQIYNFPASVVVENYVEPFDEPDSNYDFSSNMHTTIPTTKPTTISTTPTTIPTTIQTTIPTKISITVPTTIPITILTTILTTIPTIIQTTITTNILTTNITTIPTLIITTIPTTIPTTIIITIPSIIPTTTLFAIPTTISTTIPTTIPSTNPTIILTTIPISIPSNIPTTNSIFNKIYNLNLTNELKQEIINKIGEEIIAHSIDDILDDIINDKGDDLRIDLEDIKYHISSTLRQINNNYENISSINLGECENILKREYHIDKNKALILFKVDSFINSSTIPVVIYEVFHPETKEKLNLTYCEGKKIDIIYPVDINEEELFKYNQSSSYYSDICWSYTSPDGTDITIKDRQEEYINNMSLCEEDCDYSNYNSSTKKVSCQCFIKVELPIISEIKISKDKLRNNFVDIKKIVNLNVMKCYKLLFEKDRIMENIGFYILLIIIFIYIICSIYFCIKGYDILYNDVK